MSGDWWREAFGAGYADVYAHRDDASATSEIADLLPRLRDAPGPILDAGCGNGRHLAALRAAGIPAVGFDFSRHQLDAARLRSAVAGRLVRADLRVPPFVEASWGAVLLLFTGFGYFSDAENAACLARLARLLAPGGWLVLDLPDPEHVRRTLVASSERSIGDGGIVCERRRLVGDRVEKDVEVTSPAGVHAWHESVHLYDREDIAGMAKDNCMEPVECVGSIGRQIHWLRRT